MANTLGGNTLGGVPVQFDPTTRDYEAFRDMLLRLIPRITPEWTDFYPADPGVALLEGVSGASGVLSYLQDRVEGEGKLSTAQLRSSVVDLLRLIGYELSPRSAASVPLVVRTNTSLTLPAGWAVTSAATSRTPSVRFELLQSVFLVADGYHTTSDYAAALQAIVAPEVVYINDDLVVVHGTSVVAEPLGVSNGDPNQVFQLAEGPIAVNADSLSPIALRVGAAEWTAVTNFAGTESDSEVYTLEIDHNGLGSARFGDGASGKIPTIGADLDTDYRIGGGEVGNSVGIGALNAQEVAVDGVISVTNPVQPSGGQAEEPISVARVLGPQSLRALDRAVTLEDFEFHAKNVPGGGVRGARAATGGAYDVTVYVAAEGDNPVPSGRWYPELDSGTGLLGAVGRYLTEKKVVPARLDVQAVTTVRPRIAGTVFVYSNVLRDDAKYAVNAALQALFDTRKAEFGKGLPYSEIDQLIENTPGVDYVNLSEFYRLPATRFFSGKEAAFLTSLVTVDGLTQQVNGDDYSISWQNGATYTLQGALSGPVVDINGVQRVFGTATDYVVDHHIDNADGTVATLQRQFRIRIDVGPTLPNAGDVWRFGVDYYRSNMNLSPFELLLATFDAHGNPSPDEIALEYGGGVGAR